MRDKIKALAPRAGRGLRSALALAIGGIGGWAFYHWHMPLAWMLGSMAACGAGALLRLPLSSPATIRPLMTAVIGTMLGTAFGPHLLDHVDEWLIPLAGLLVFIPLAGFTSYQYFRRIAGFDMPTAYFSGMPGGLVEMVTLGTERGGDERTIALIHAARIFLVVFSLPFLIELLFGMELPRTVRDPIPLSAVGLDDALWFTATLVAGLVIGKILRLPARFLLGPMLVSAAIHYFGGSDFVLPTVVISAAQVVIGTTVGCRFVGVPFRVILRILKLAAGSTAILMALTLLSAKVVSLLSGEAETSLLLAYSPGGLAEMSLIALSLDIGIAFVIVHHIVRVLLVVAGSSAMFSLLALRETKPKG